MSEVGLQNEGAILSSMGFSESVMSVAPVNALQCCRNDQREEQAGVMIFLVVLISGRSAMRVRTASPLMMTTLVCMKSVGAR